jgi:SAM-dependent methyltransferase
MNDLEAPVTHDAASWHPSPADVDNAMKARGPWIYDGTDPALALFTAAITRFNLRFPPYSRILELGCAESDWLERMRRWDATFDLTGVDARRHVRHEPQPHVKIVEGSAISPDLFPDESFDWIVLLGALEHFGLGFYQDEVKPAGDIDTMYNVARWLKPGGFVYFDVPVQPFFDLQLHPQAAQGVFVTENRHFRMYRPDVVGDRLIIPGLLELNRAYSLPEPHAGTWCHEPREQLVPYWFVAVLAQKVVR